MKTKKLANLFAIVICVISMTQSSNAQLTKIQKWQQPSYFKGFNIEQHGWYELQNRFLNQQDFIDMKSTCANLVVITSFGTWEENSPYPKKLCGTNCLSTFVEEWIDTLVTYAKGAGLYYVISLRSGPGFLDGDSITTRDSIWKSSVMQQRYASMIKEISARYLGDSLFVGIAPMNEPHPFPMYYNAPIDTITSLITANPLTNVNQFMKYCIDSVRTADPDLPVIVESVNWTLPLYFYFVQNQTDNKVVYSAHFYDPVAYSSDYNYNIDSNINALSYPNTYLENVYYNGMMYYNKPFLKDSVSKFIRSLQTTYNVPIFMGEFGLSLPQVGGVKYLWDHYDIARGYGWSFALWAWRGTRDFNYEVADSLSILPTASAQINTQYWDTVKLMMCSIPIGIQEQSLFDNFNIYPNPTNQYAILVFENSKKENCTLTLYDIHGRLVLIITDITTDKVTIETKSMTSGFYFLQLRTNKQIIRTGKLIVE